MTKLYVDAINDPNSIPNVQTAWETHVQRKCKDAKRKAMQAYDKKMTRSWRVMCLLFDKAWPYLTKKQLVFPLTIPNEILMSLW